MKQWPSEKAILKLEQMLAYEKKAWQQGFQCLAGIDEAGRGPLAGPVVAAACVLNPDRPVYGLDDSKKLTPARREYLFEQIKEQAIAWQVGITGPGTIDRDNILQATCEAMREAVRGLGAAPDLLLVDAVKLAGTERTVWPIIRGDSLSASIAAASILAKVTRDRLMVEYDRVYPEYGFSQHKGYGTPIHYEAILRHGPCPIHRLSFLRSIGSQLAACGFTLDEGRR